MVGPFISLLNIIIDNVIYYFTIATFAAPSIHFSVSDSIYPPGIADLSEVLNPSRRTNGGYYSGPDVPGGSYGIYNYCNMPHVRKSEYVMPNDTNATIKYVEVIHRHHRRTTDNPFPYEVLDLNVSCRNLKEYNYEQPEDGSGAAAVYSRTYVDRVNRFSDMLYFSTSCESGHLILGGLEDSIQHGKDLYDVYGDMLGIIPQFPDERTYFRTTPTTLTRQVASGIVKGMFHGQVASLQIYQQPSNFDSLAPDYLCPFADDIRKNYQNVPAWFEHLKQTADFQNELSLVLGVQGNIEWSSSYDHFFDSFSTRTCNMYHLPCNVTTGVCIDMDQAEQVFRLGDYEYDYIYNSAENVTEYNAYHYGVWIGELLENLKNAVNRASPVQYRHNIAHDGSMAPLLGNLGITFLRWPGLGAELSFELWESGENYFMRVLYGGQPLQTTWAGALSWLPYDQFVSHMSSKFPSDIFTRCSS